MAVRCAAVVITVAVAVLFYSGPIAEPNVTPDAYWWIGDRPIAKIDTLYLGTITRLSGIMLGAAFAMVWRPLAIVRGPLRSKGRMFDAARARRDRCVRVAVLEHLPGHAGRCRPVAVPRWAVHRRTRHAGDHRSGHPPGRSRQPPPRQPGVPVGRDPLVRAVPLPLADLPDDPRRRRQQADVLGVRPRDVPDRHHHRGVVPADRDPDPSGPVLGALAEGLRRQPSEARSWR